MLRNGSKLVQFSQLFNSKRFYLFLLGRPTSVSMCSETEENDGIIAF